MRTSESSQPQSEEQGVEVDAIVALFESRQKANKALPEQKLLECGPQALAPLLNEFAREWRRCSEQRRRHRATARKNVGQVSLLAALSLLALSRLGLEAVALFVLFFLVSFLLVCAWTDPKGVLEFRDSRTHAVMTALMCVLRRWGVYASGRLTRNQRTALCCVLGSCCLASSVYYDAMIAAAILGELEEVGDGQALSLVRVLADASAVDDVHPVVYRAANRCLPVLYQRSLQEGVRAILLRPAPAPEVPAAILLRPAQDGRKADPHVLLRPSSPDHKKPGQ